MHYLICLFAIMEFEYNSVKSALFSQTTLLSDDVKVKIIHPTIIFLLGAVVWWIKELASIQFYLILLGILVGFWFWCGWITQFYHSLDFDDYDVLPSLIFQPTQKQTFFQSKLDEKRREKHSHLKIILADLGSDVNPLDTVEIAWFNTLIRVLWRNLKAAIEDYVLHVFWPNVRYVIKHNSTVFDLEMYSFGLGLIAPKIESINIHELDEEEDKLVADVKITWASEVNADIRIITDITPAYLKLDSLLVNLNMRITLSGLMKDPPFLKSFSFCFLEEPLLNWRLGGVGQFTNHSAMHKTLKNLIYKEIRQFIYPTSMTIPINSLPIPAAEEFFKMFKKGTFIKNVIPKPTGILSVAIKRCRNLPVKDWYSSLFYPKLLYQDPKAWFKGIIPKRVSSDPYVEVKVGNMKIRSKVCYQTINPELNFLCDIPIDCPKGNKFQIDIMDYDLISYNDLLGFRVENLSVIVDEEREPGTKIEDNMSWRGLLGSSVGECFMNNMWSPT